MNANLVNSLIEVLLFPVLFYAEKRTKNGLTILTRFVYRLRLDGKSSIWSLRPLFYGQSHVTRFIRRSELARASARLSSEAFLIDAKLSERSRQAE
jgi:hypothetical protein